MIFIGALDAFMFITKYF